MHVSAGASAQRTNPPAQLYDVELLPPRAQGPNLSAHVCVMWQLVAPHKRKHIIIQVLIDGPTLSLLPMELRRDETVETIPPAVDTLCARHVGNLGRFFLQTPLPSELTILVANSHSLDIPGHGLDRFRPSRRAIRKQGGNPGGAEAAKQRRIHQLLCGLWWGRGARRDQLDRQADDDPRTGALLQPGDADCPCQYFGKGLSQFFIELRQRAWAAATSVWKLGFVGLTLVSPVPCPSPGVHTC